MQRGHSLIELVISLVIGASLLAVALPSLRGIQHSSVMRLEITRLVSMLHRARSEAWGSGQHRTVSVTAGKVSLRMDQQEIASYYPRDSVNITDGTGQDWNVYFYSSGAVSPISIHLSMSHAECRVIVSLRGRIRTSC